jgi:hypothetical protein
MEPMAGIEPATNGLRNRCSTTELHWRPVDPKQTYFALIRQDDISMAADNFQGKAKKQSMCTAIFESPFVRRA